MVIILSDQLDDVRRELSDITEDWVTDRQVYQAIDQANKLITQIVPSTVDESMKTLAIQVLSAYYTYLVYTSMAEQRLGQLPETVITRLNALSGKARSFMSLISNVELNDDLTIATRTLDMSPVVISLGNGVMD